MDSKDIDVLFRELRAGRTLEVPFSTRMWPETEAIKNVLRLNEAGAFELKTTLREFWAGHGWSLEQTELETRSEAELRTTLTYVERSSVKVL